MYSALRSDDPGCPRPGWTVPTPDTEGRRRELRAEVVERAEILLTELLRDWPLKGVHRQQPGRLPVRRPVPAVPVILQDRQLLTIGAEPVQQLWHRLPAVGVVLADALSGAMPHDGPRLLRGCASVHARVPRRDRPGRGLPAVTRRVFAVLNGTSQAA